MSLVSLAHQSVSDIPIQTVIINPPLTRNITDVTEALSSTLVHKQEPPVDQHQQSIPHKYPITKIQNKFSSPPFPPPYSSSLPHLY